VIELPSSIARERGCRAVGLLDSLDCIEVPHHCIGQPRSHHLFLISSVHLPSFLQYVCNNGRTQPDCLTQASTASSNSARLRDPPQLSEQTFSKHQVRERRPVEGGSKRQLDLSFSSAYRDNSIMRSSSCSEEMPAKFLSTSSLT